MRLIALGLNHSTAPVALREQLSFSANELPLLLAADRRPAPLVVLSTCNRTELYAHSNDADQLRHWLVSERRMAMTDVQPFLYEQYGSDALKHLIRVAAGLDSMVLGEPQIFGQLKRAWSLSRDHYAVDAALNRWFEQGFAAAKRVRSETAIGAHAVSMGFAVVTLAHQVFNDLKATTAVLIAAGEMNELVARHLIEHGIGRLIIINRTPDRASHLAGQLSSLAHLKQTRLEVRPWAALNESLKEADILSSCTGSAQWVVHARDIKQALKQRRYAPMLLIDLAMPRDLDPAIARLDEAYLYSVDDLQHVIDHNQAQRREAAREAHSLVDHLTNELTQRQRVQDASSVIQGYRDHAERMASDEQQKALQALQNGADPEAVIAQLTHSLTRKLSHAPSQLLRLTAQHHGPEQVNWVSQVLSQHRSTPILKSHMDWPGTSSATDQSTEP